MPAYTTVATCALAQWAMDFTGNLERIKESIKISKEKHAKYRLGPELEVCGYGCEDHFFEADTVDHSWEAIYDILQSDLTDNIVCDIGMPVIHENVRYNCRVLLLNRKVLLIRPKACLADDGSYRESRWFTAWTKGYSLVDFSLPRQIRELTGQTTVKMGIGAIRFADTMLGNETCEELFTPENPAIVLGLAGCEIIGNGSGSHHAVNRLSRRIELMEETTRKNGGLYLYANSQGCDGSRLYFDGAAMIVMNGVLLALGTQFSMKDVEVVTATVDLSDIGNFRAAIASRGVQAARGTPVPHVSVEWYMCNTEEEGWVQSLTVYNPIPCLNSPEEQIAHGPSCWLWDYLRRSGLPGFFLPLSGDPDSAATAAIVAILCQTLYETISPTLKGTRNNAVNAANGIPNNTTIVYDEKTRQLTLSHLRRVCRDVNFDPKSPKDIAKKIFYTCFMKTNSSSKESEDRSRKLANEIGANFDVVDIQPMVDGAIKSWSTIGPVPDINHLDSAQNVACWNLEGRCRASFSYFCAQLCLWKENPKEMHPGQLLVLGSTNLDDSIQGTFTKFDCSSAADLNPIGSLSTGMRCRFLRWAGEKRHLPSLLTYTHLSESNGLQPSSDISSQWLMIRSPISPDAPTDDNFVPAISDDDLDTMGKLRMGSRCGPLAMFRKLIKIWEHKYTPQVTAERVRNFFYRYAINRHKATVLAPSYHLESHSVDDNRYDMRQILYDSSWSWQFKCIERQLEKEKSKKRDRDDFIDETHEK